MENDFWLIQGDCLEKLKELDDNSVDSVVTDPPYGISMMGKIWDKGVPATEVWAECLRVLKPGGHLLAFAGTRTQHRMATNIEDAGFEIRDMIAWVYGSGFPKSQNVSKAIDKAAGAEREVVGKRKHPTLKDTDKLEEQANAAHGNNEWSREWDITSSSTDAAKQWDGWGSALKPALEPITMARKPLTGTIVNNVLENGTGAINIDGCRIPSESGGRPKRETHARREDVEYNGNSLCGRIDGSLGSSKAVGTTTQGRFPANLIHDGSEEVTELFPTTGGSGRSRTLNRSGVRAQDGWGMGSEQNVTLPDSGVGSAARFFYCAKANKKDRNEGLENFESSEKYTGGNYSQSPTCETCHKTLNGTNDHSECSGKVYYKEMDTKVKNNHPTVKPTDLMKYLCRLVTPPKGIVLDPFMGSGSTGKAARLEGFKFIGIELDEDYCTIAQQRLENATPPNTLDDWFD